MNSNSKSYTNIIYNPPWRDPRALQAAQGGGGVRKSGQTSEKVVTKRSLERMFLVPLSSHNLWR